MSPSAENTRVDLVLGRGDGLLRIQCKTGRLRRGAVRFRVCSSYGHHSNSRAKSRDYHGEVDGFAVYCPETATVYLVPIHDLPTRHDAMLRVDPPRNNQRRRIRLARDYENCARRRQPAGPRGDS
jgi:hypothetical protein